MSRHLFPHSQAQQQVQTLLDELTGSGQETGLQVAAYLEGERVLHAWSGLADPADGRAVDARTLFLSFSCGKGPTATVIHQLVQAGQLDYDQAISQIWPEFGARGKAAITLRQLLCHQAGIPQLPQLNPLTIDLADLCQPEAMCQAIAQLEPLWQPGTATGYHAITQGFILAEIVRRVTGLPFAEVFQGQICQPLGLQDCFFGVPDHDLHRIARIEGQAAPWGEDPAALIHRAIPPALSPSPAWNRQDIFQAVIPASNLVTTADNLAAHYAALCPAGLQGRHLLSPAQWAQATTLQTDAPDQVLGLEPIPKGLGYWLGGTTHSYFANRPSVFGHTGAGGSIGLADPEQNFSFALMKNQLTWPGGENTDKQVIKVVRQALGLK